MELSEDPEVNHLRLIVDADVSVSAEKVGEQLAPRSMAGSWVELLRGAEARDPGVDGTWCVVPGLPYESGMAGTGMHYEHVIGDGRIAECFEFL